MIGALKGLPGKIKYIKDYLTTNWTAARAAKLDFLTAAVAVANTALSTSIWTSARAAKLDGIIQTTVINSNQTGYINTAVSSGSGEDYKYIDVTISAVTIAKCIINVMGGNNNGGGVLLLARLTSTTNLRISAPSSTAPAPVNIIVRWNVVEFK